MGNGQYPAMGNGQYPAMGNIQQWAMGNENVQRAISSAVANGLKECADAADTRHRARLVLHLQCNT